MKGLSLNTIAILIFDTIIITSVLYNIGYFWELNLLPSHLMLNFIDIAMSALVWMPIAIVFVIFEIFFCIITFEKLNDQADKLPHKTHHVFKSFLWISSILIFAVVIFNLFYGQYRIVNLLGAPFLIINAWLLIFLDRIFTFIRNISYSITTRILVCLIALILPFVCFIPYLIGVCIGNYDLQLLYPNATITTKADKKIPIILLRTLEKGVLLKIPEDKTFAFLPWENVEKIDLTVTPPSKINNGAN